MNAFMREGAVEVAHVRNQLRIAIETARQKAQTRRQQIAEAEQAFERFIAMATPVLRQLAGAMRAEGLAFTLFTPEHALRLASDRSRVDFVELALDTSVTPPTVMARVSYARGSRTLDVERPLKPGSSPDTLTEEDLLAFILTALDPWLER
jgi:hypothetical protein